MTLFSRRACAAASLIALCLTHGSMADEAVGSSPTIDPALKVWLLPETPPSPGNNVTTPERAALGGALFFDARLSGDGKLSCASCHNPEFGWSDGQPTAVGFGQKVLHRASPTIVNVGYNSIHMWDGRARTLEKQALGPMMAAEEMNSPMEDIVGWISRQPEYISGFRAAYPNEGISLTTLAKALAAFQRTVVSRDSAFDRWIKGDASAMTAQQIRGFEIFRDPEGGNCEVCHSAPNFTDNGFHNVGLASYDREDPDMGRFAHVPIGVLKGAFKTPTLRDIERTAPYFHDGSAATLAEVIDHYARGGVTDTDLSPNMKPLTLSAQDKSDLVAFLKALSSPNTPGVGEAPITTEVPVPDMPGASSGAH